MRRYINHAFWLLPIVFFHLAFVLMPVFKNASGYYIYLTDIYTPFYPVDSLLDNAYSSWSPYLFGITNRPSLISFFVPYLARLIGLANIGLLTFLGLLFGSIFLYFFLLKTGITRSLPVAMVAGMVYGLNGATLKFDNVPISTSTGNMVLFAISPVIALFLFRIFIDHKRLPYSIIGLGFALAIAGSVSPVPMPYTVILSAAFFIASFIYKQAVIAVKSVFALICSYVLYFAFALPSISAFIYDIAIKGYTGGFVAQFGNKALFTVHRNFFYIDWYNDVFPFYTSPLTTLSIVADSLSTGRLQFLLRLLAIIPVAVALVPLFLKRNRVRNSLGISLWCTIIVLTTYSILVKENSGLLALVFSNKYLGPIMGAFLTPTQIILPLVILLGLALAVGLSELTDFIKEEVHRDFVLPSGFYATFHISRVELNTFLIVLICLTILASSLLSNDAMILRMGDLTKPNWALVGQGGRHFQPDNYMPGYFLDIADFLNHEREKVGPFRVLWLPQGSPQYYTFVGGIVDPSGILFPIPSERMTKVFKETVRSIRQNSTNHLAEQYAMFNIRYIVVLKDYAQTMSPEFIDIGIQLVVGPPSRFNQVFEKTPSLQEVRDTDNYSVYENTLWYPMVSASYKETEFVEHPVMLQPNMFNLTGITFLQQKELYAYLKTPQVRLLSAEPLYAPNHYNVFINTTSPTYIVLGQRFDPSWEATSVDSDGKTHVYYHFKIFDWANGYYIDSNTPVNVEIRFKYQETYNKIILLWVITSAMMGVALLVLFRGRMKAS
jgi:hypothetical protein